MRRIAILFVILSTISCTDVEKSPEPENLFSKDKMAAVLTDLYVIEGAIASNKGAYLKSGVMPSSYIYDRHNTDSLSFKENLDFYTDRIEDYLIILDQVQSNLKALQDSVNTRQELINREEEKRVPKIKYKDSIKSSVENRDKKTY